MSNLCKKKNIDLSTYFSFPVYLFPNFFDNVAIKCTQMYQIDKR